MATQYTAAQITALIDTEFATRKAEVSARGALSVYHDLEAVHIHSVRLAQKVADVLNTQNVAIVSVNADGVSDTITASISTTAATGLPQWLSTLITLLTNLSGSLSPIMQTILAVVVSLLGGGSGSPA